jgi:hypothetical protein
MKIIFIINFTICKENIIYFRLKRPLAKCSTIRRKEIMPAQSNTPCWEIIQCKKKEACTHYTGKRKKACWDLVKEDDFCSFHICVDCLVYLAHNMNPTFSEEKYRSIMRRRKKIRALGYMSNASRAITCSLAIPAKRGLKKYVPTLLIK